MKHVYRDGDVINTTERHYHFDRIATAIIVVALLGISYGILAPGHHLSLGSGCVDEADRSGMLFSHISCASNQTLERVGYGEWLCRCKAPAKPAVAAQVMSWPYGPTWVPAPAILTTASDAGVSWRAAP